MVLGIGLVLDAGLTVGLYVALVTELSVILGASLNIDFDVDLVADTRAEIALVSVPSLDAAGLGVTGAGPDVSAGLGRYFGSSVESVRILVSVLIFSICDSVTGNLATPIKLT